MEFGMDLRHDKMKILTAGLLFPVKVAGKIRKQINKEISQEPKKQKKKEQPSLFLFCHDAQTNSMLQLSKPKCKNAKMLSLGCSWNQLVCHVIILDIYDRHDIHIL